jgi:hypothetical protein
MAELSHEEGETQPRLVARREAGVPDLLFDLTRERSW